jgi:tetratricopeptide (TPR) repeat protein
MNNNKSLTIEEVFKLAVKNHQEGKTDIAQEYYNQVLKIDPNHSQALNNIGVIFKGLGENQKAKECYEKAIKINPNYVDVYYNLGKIFQRLSDLQKAKDCYEKAIKIDPNYADAHNNLGIIFKELGNFQKAKYCYEKAIGIDPNYVNAHNNLGIIFKELGQYQKAKDCFEQAIKINPDYAEAYNNLGTLSSLAGKIQEAKGCYKKVIKINSNYSEAHNNLGIIYRELGEYQKAKACFERAIEINPNDAEVNNNLGLTFKNLGDPQKAIIYFEKAIEIKPGISDISNNLLKSSYETNNQSILFKELDSIIKEGKMNAVIGSIVSRTEIKYGVKKENPFCNDPLDYILKTDLIKKYDFKNVIIDRVYNILKNDSLSNKTQTLITNGYQTAGNLFANEDINTKEIQKIIHTEIEKYFLKFKDSKEGFIKNWPNNYNLKGWLICLKKGGRLKAHMHELGWLSGSIYVNVPQKLQTDSGNLVVCIDENDNDKSNNKNKKSIDVVSGSLCLFPSSLLHYTVPFEAEEERIVLGFDMIPN